MAEAASLSQAADDAAKADAAAAAAVAEAVAVDDAVGAVLRGSSQISLDLVQEEEDGGPVFEVLSSQGTGAAMNWKFTAKSFIKRNYEKELKGFCYHCEKMGKMTLPKHDKQSAYLIQPYVVFQLNVPLGEQLSIELCVSDLTQNHRRFFISTASHHTKVTALHVTLPLPLLRGVWMNLCFDLTSLVSDIFRGQTFRCLNSISLTGTFRLRKVFTMRNRPPDTMDDDFAVDAFPRGHVEAIPRNIQYPHGVEWATQVINIPRLAAVEAAAASKHEETGMHGHQLHASGHLIEPSGAHAKHVGASGVGGRHLTQAKSNKVDTAER
ncbi:hypothetical protein HK104_006277 [Borealophlyctis nickersoniae]|nr:hypothetical protein HK104_006277 [Borealophlyctis nickersoniae]